MKTYFVMDTLQSGQKSAIVVIHLLLKPPIYITTHQIAGPIVITIFKVLISCEIMVDWQHFI